MDAVKEDLKSVRMGEEDRARWWLMISRAHDQTRVIFVKVFIKGLLTNSDEGKLWLKGNMCPMKLFNPTPQTWKKLCQ